MNQQKIGCFLKKLRKENNITQEQFAEILGVSNRSISRWETGTNMPDLDILIQLADYYGVELTEILDGERSSENMDKKTEESVLKTADYSNQEKIIMTKRMNRLFIMGTIAILIYLAFDLSGLTDATIYNHIASFALGVAFAILVLGVLFTSRYMMKLRAFKMRLLKREN